MSGPPDEHTSQRLATYGTLRPGEANHHLVAHLPGQWRSGWVRGRFQAQGWGLTHGFPALVPDPAGERIAVSVLESSALVAYWPTLDAFEGPAYVRVLVEVELEDGGFCIAHLYAAALRP